MGQLLVADADAALPGAAAAAAADARLVPETERVAADAAAVEDSSVPHTRSVGAHAASPEPEGAAADPLVSSPPAQAELMTRLRSREAALRDNLAAQGLNSAAVSDIVTHSWAASTSQGHHEEFGT
eukprot:SAG11_NODE_3366_length_2493_cov_13.732247_2_plen_126_part_00